MNSALNILLFLFFVLILVAAFLGVNLYVNKLSNDDAEGGVAIGESAKNLLPTDLIASIKEPQNLIAKALSKSARSSVWVDNFAQKNINNFSYPSSELAIALDFSNAQKTDTLAISNLDSYKFFCLNEVLKANGIRFAYIKKADQITLEVALRDNLTRSNLTNELKKYGISYQIY